MNKYESYKKVNLPWLKEVPSHWEVHRLANLGKLKGGISSLKQDDFGVGFPFVTYNDVNRNFFNDNLYSDLVNSTEMDREKYSLKKGDILFTGSSETIEELGYSSVILQDIPNAVFNGFCIRLRTNGINDLKFLGYMLRASNLREYLVARNNAVTRANLSQSLLKNMPIIIPPLQEQTQIANYLDWKISEIDRLIAKEKEKIKELERIRKSIITKIVTEGVWKNKEKIVRNVDWIYKTPKDWKIIKLKFLGKAKNGLTYEPKELSDDGTIVLRSSNIQNEKLDLKDTVYLKSKIPSNMLLKKDDILICSRNGSRNLIGKNLLIEEGNKYTFGAFMCRFRSKYNHYLYWVFNSEMFDYYMKLFTTSTINQLTNSDFYSMYVPLPTDEEQEIINIYLSKKRKQLNNLIDKTNQQIQNLESLKQALISEVVTGQIDLRDVVIPEYEKFTLENDLELEEELEEDA